MPSSNRPDSLCNRRQIGFGMCSWKWYVANLSWNIPVKQGVEGAGTPTCILKFPGVRHACSTCCKHYPSCSNPRKCVRRWIIAAYKGPQHIPGKISWSSNTDNWCDAKHLVGGWPKLTGRVWLPVNWGDGARGWTFLPHSSGNTIKSLLCFCSPDPRMARIASHCYSTWRKCHLNHSSKWSAGVMWLCGR